MNTTPAPDALDFATVHRPQPVRIDVRQMTPWRSVEKHMSVDGKTVVDGGVNEMGGPLVEGCIVEIDELDAYDGVLSHTVAIKHRFWDQKKKKQDGDISVSRIDADMMMDQISDNQVIHRGLKTRFKGVIDEYVKLLQSEGRDYPIALLADKIYPDLINALRAIGITTAQAFVEMTNEQLEVMRDQLRRDQKPLIAMHVTNMQKRAADRLHELGFEVKKTKPAKSAA